MLLADQLPAASQNLFPTETPDARPLRSSRARVCTDMPNENTTRLTID
jgi:hypothetical protein